jgi:hypothetical protein
VNRLRQASVVCWNGRNGTKRVASPDDWRKREIVSAVVAHFIGQIGGDTTLTLDDLRADPTNALERHTDIALMVTRGRLGSCSVFGHYNPHPPTITLSETQSARDAFTVLHEYCHHLQMQDAVWQDVLWQINSRLRLWIEEGGCDAFASSVLIPAELVASTVSARGLRDLHAQTRASRQATVVRAVRAVESRDAAFAVVCELDGTVMFGISTAPELLAPPQRLQRRDSRCWGVGRTIPALCRKRFRTSFCIEKCWDGQISGEHRVLR